MSSIIENLVESLQSRREKSLQDYAAIVRVIAGDGKPPGTASIETTLAAAGKTIADLQADVDLATRRNELRGQIKLAETLRAERPDIDAEIGKAAEKLQAAQDVFDLAVKPLRAKIAEISSAIHAAGLASGELRRTTPDGFDEAAAELEKNVRAASDEKNRAVKHLREVESRLAGEQAAEYPDESVVATYKEQVANATERLKDAADAEDGAVKTQEEHCRAMLAS